MPTGGIRKVCDQGHVFYKSSDCRSCPECERLKKPSDGFLSLFAAPARRALQERHISSVMDLMRFSEREILAWHGIGTHAMTIIKKAFKDAGINFKKEKQ